MFDGAIIAVVLRLVALLLRILDRSFDGAIIAITPAITIAAVTTVVDEKKQEDNDLPISIMLLDAIYLSEMDKI